MLVWLEVVVVVGFGGSVGYGCIDSGCVVVV